MENIILVGYGGHAKSIADCIERLQKYKIVGYTDLEQYDSPYNYLGGDTILRNYYNQGIKKAVVGIGYMGKGEVRQKLYEELKSIGYSLPIIADPSAIISKSAQIGEGTFVGKGAIINAEATIGKMVIINTKALVEHECIVGDYAHIAVAAVLCGQVEIGENAFVGANATVIQGRKIVAHQIVPAGSTVRLKDW